MLLQALQDARVRTALVPIEVARACLAVDEDTVLHMIENGELRWAWDIAPRRASIQPADGGKIRAIRVWSASIAAKQAGDGQPDARHNEVVDGLVDGLSKIRTRLRATEVRSLLCCSGQTITRLIEAGNLQGELEHGTRWVDRTSLQQFLNGRLIR